MRTLLDEAEAWFLKSLVLSNDLRLVLIEGVRADKPETTAIGHVEIEAFPIEPAATSRRVAVCFSHVVAFQVVDESYTTYDETEARDDPNRLQELSKSAYLDYVTENHGWFSVVAGPASHYRLLTENEVVDVVSHDRPVVEVAVQE